MLSNFALYNRISKTIQTMYDDRETLKRIRFSINKTLSANEAKSARGNLELYDDSITELYRDFQIWKQTIESLPQSSITEFISLSSDIGKTKNVTTTENKTPEVDFQDLYIQSSSEVIKLQTQNYILESKLNKVNKQFALEKEQLELTLTNEFESQTNLLNNELIRQKEEMTHLKVETKAPTKAGIHKLIEGFKTFTIENQNDKLIISFPFAAETYLKYSDLLNLVNVSKQNLCLNQNLLKYCQQNITTLIEGKEVNDMRLLLSTSSSNLLLVEKQVQTLQTRKEVLFNEIAMLKESKQFSKWAMKQSDPKLLEEKLLKKNKILEEKKKKQKEKKTKRQQEITIIKKNDEFQKLNQTDLKRGNPDLAFNQTDKKSDLTFSNVEEMKSFLLELEENIRNYKVKISMAGYMQQRFKNRALRLYGKMKSAWKKFIPELQQLLIDLKMW
jgi:hypothetical protein